MEIKRNENSIIKQKFQEFPENKIAVKIINLYALWF